MQCRTGLQPVTFQLLQNHISQHALTASNCHGMLGNVVPQKLKSHRLESLHYCLHYISGTYVGEYILKLKGMFRVIYNSETSLKEPPRFSKKWSIRGVVLWNKRPINTKRYRNCKLLRSTCKASELRSCRACEIKVFLIC